MSGNKDWEGVITPEVKEAPPELKRPSMYNVIFLNDDYTPFDFVILALTTHFGKSEDEANRITLDVHQKGKGIAGTYSRDVAETKAYLVMEWAQQEGHPLHLAVEPNED